MANRGFVGGCIKRSVCSLLQATQLTFISLYNVTTQPVLVASPACCHKKTLSAIQKNLKFHSNSIPATFFQRCSRSASLYSQQIHLFLSSTLCHACDTATRKYIHSHSHGHLKGNFIFALVLSKCLDRTSLPNSLPSGQPMSICFGISPKRGCRPPPSI